MIEEYGLCRLDPNCEVGYYAGTKLWSLVRIYTKLEFDIETFVGLLFYAIDEFLLLNFFY